MNLQSDLFGQPAPTLPDGLAYRDHFITEAQEAALLGYIGELPLNEALYKGYTARRRIVSYGSRYDYDGQRLLPAQPLAEFLLPLRDAVARWAGLAPAAFTNALVAEYRPGTPLGWHRDVPDYEIVAGVSLAAPARMRWRRYPPVAPKKDDVLSLELAPRSVYVLRGPARWEWQHSVAPTLALRYSITFRTRRSRSAARETAPSMQPQDE